MLNVAKSLFAECHNAEYLYMFQYSIIMLYIVKHHYAECQYCIIMLCIVKHHYAEFQYSIIMLCFVKHHYAEFQYSIIMVEWQLVEWAVGRRALRPCARWSTI